MQILGFRRQLAGAGRHLLIMIFNLMDLAFWSVLASKTTPAPAAAVTGRRRFKSFANRTIIRPASAIKTGEQQVAAASLHREA